MSDAVLTICLFNVMNRMSEGHGVKDHAKIYASWDQAFQEHRYAPRPAALPPVKP